jgi:hypothetical protein
MPELPPPEGVLEVVECCHLSKGSERVGRGKGTNVDWLKDEESPLRTQFTLTTSRSVV